MNEVKIKLEQSGAEVTLRKWVTGRQAEYINEPLFEAVEVKAGDGASPSVNNISMAKVVEMTHREIESFVVSITGVEVPKDEKILDTILNLPEDDYKFVTDEISKLRKKK